MSPVVRHVFAACAALVVGLGVALAVLVHQRNDARAEYARASLDVSNARAAADTTRVVVVDSLTRVVERLAVQRVQTPDAVDRRVGRERVALDSLQAVVRALRAIAPSSGDVVTVTNTTGDTVRRGVFDVRDPPYTARAVVELPPRGRGSIDLSVTLDTIPLTIRPSCGPADANGIRPAAVSVAAPAWVSVGLVRVEQSPDLCRSPALERAADVDAARRDRRLRLALVAGYGYTIAPGVPGELRGFVGLGLAQPIPLPRWLPFR